MRLRDQEINDLSIIEKILKEADICRIGFSINNTPYIVPVNFAYHNNQIYIHSAREGFKIEIIKINPYVCFEVESNVEIIPAEIPCKWATKYRSVIGYGTIKIIINSEEKKKGLDIIMSKYLESKTFDYKKNNLDRMVILKIEIEKISAKQSGNFNK